MENFVRDRVQDIAGALVAFSAAYTVEGSTQPIISETVDPALTVAGVLGGIFLLANAAYEINKINKINSNPERDLTNG